jgi:hypothetical protein
MRIIKPFLLPLAAFIAIAAAAIWLNSRPSWIGWPGWQLAACYPGCFCEAFHAGGIAQPWSAYSNLFYILAGLMILATRDLPAGDTRANRMTAARGYITGFGWAVIGIGVTSFFFHVTLTQIGRWLDYMGMYAFTGYALTYSLARLRRRNDAAFAIAFAVLLATLGALWFAAPAYRRVLLGGLILGVALIEAAAHWLRRPMRIRTRYLIASLGCFLVAYWINMADEAGVLCVSASTWQWHALWHLLTAASTVLLYVYYRSEGEKMS